MVNCEVIIKISSLFPAFIRQIRKLCRGQQPDHKES